MRDVDSRQPPLGAVESAKRFPRGIRQCQGHGHSREAAMPMAAAKAANINPE